MIDPAAALDAMVASDLAVLWDDGEIAAGLDRDAEGIRAWLAGGPENPWQHARPFTDQPTTKADADANRDS